MNVADTDREGVILIADDERDSRELFHAFVRRMGPGYRVICVEDGAQALEIIEREDVDLLLLDLMMPGVDGFAVLDALTERGALPDLPIVVVTASRERSRRLEALRRGACDFLVKPVDRREFQARVRNHIERKRQRDLLAAREQRQEALYRTVVETAPNVIIHADRDANIKFINHSPSGCDPGDVLGTNVFDYVPREERDRVRAAFEHALTANEEVQLTLFAQPNTQSARWFELRLRKVSEQDQVVAVIADITAREETRRRLEAQTYELERAQQVASIGSWRYWPRANVLEWSRQTHFLLGVPIDEPVDLAKFFALIHPDDRASVQHSWSRALKGLLHYDLEFRVLTPDGVRWIHGVAEQDEIEGEIVYMGTVQDITGRIRTQEEFAAANRRLEAFKQRIELATKLLPLDLYEGRLEGTNYKPIWSTRGVDWWQDIYPEDRGDVEELLTQVSMGELEEWSISYRGMPDATGEVRWLENVGRCAVESGHLFGAILDVTERHHTEEALSQAQKMEALGQLAGGIAHDFNNILNSIIGFAGFVLDDLPSDSESRADIEEVLRAADRAASLTSQLLVFSRRAPDRRRALDLNDAIQKTMRMLERTVGAEVDLRFEAAARPAVVKLDPTRLDQVLLNLAVNARDAMKGQGRLTLSIEHPHVDSGPLRAGRYVRLRARDTGEGMSPEVQKRIFEPFFTTKPKGQGTGLGLSTCFSIIQSAGGHISVDSVQGQGTTFIVDLPLWDGHVEEAIAQQEQGVNSDGEHILLVEDDTMLRLALTRALERAGFSVKTARDGHEGVAMLEEFGEALDAVVSDVVMPGISGHVVLERAAAHAPQAVKVLMSGYLDDSTRPSVGVERDAILWKPFKPIALLRTLRRTLDEKRRSPMLDALTHDPMTLEMPTFVLDEEPQLSTEEFFNLSQGSVLVVEATEECWEQYRRPLQEAGYAIRFVRSRAEALVCLREDGADVVIVDLDRRARDVQAFTAQVHEVEPQLPLLWATSAPSLHTALAAIDAGTSAYLIKPLHGEELVDAVARVIRRREVERLKRQILSSHVATETVLDNFEDTRHAFEAALRKLTVHYQPILRLQDGSLFGYEALVRTSEAAFSDPQHLVEVARVFDRVEELGVRIREQILEDLEASPERVDALFVNVEFGELRFERLLEDYEPLRRVAGQVILELSERSSLNVDTTLLARLARVRSAGYRLAIDDLGSGFASLTSVAHLSPDIVKIDRSIISDIQTSSIKRNIVQALITMCRASDIVTIAEGIEEFEEHFVLEQLGCDLVQGFLYARPGRPFPTPRRDAWRGEFIDTGIYNTVTISR